MTPAEQKQFDDAFVAAQGDGKQIAIAMYELGKKVAAPAVLPAGWRAVPEVPTMDMAKAGGEHTAVWDESGEPMPFHETIGRAMLAYASMLRAAPALPAAAPVPESQPAALTQAQIDQIAEGWDGCMYDAPGEFIDIGASLRRALAALSAPPAAPVAADAGWKENTGDEPLFHVDLEFRDGEIRKGECTGSYYWHLTGQGEDIVRWRLTPVSADNQQEGQSNG